MCVNFPGRFSKSGMVLTLYDWFKLSAAFQFFKVLAVDAIDTSDPSNKIHV